jgi:hypothetical protein
MQSLLRHLDLRPHGDQLLTPSAAFWLFSARVLVVAMAFSEAVAWGYLGFLFSDGSVRWITAGFTAAIIFLVVWMIDVSLITMDRAWAEHARAILGMETGKRRGLRDGLTFALRIGLLVGSLTITAPYLAQLVFHRDIRQANSAAAAARIDSARVELATRHEAAVAAKQREIDMRRTQFEREIAGSGQSGRYGAGPAAAAIARNIRKLEGERYTLELTARRELKEFDLLTRDLEANRTRLATRYNVMLPEETIMGSYGVLQKLRERPENRQTELAIKAFLGFIFVGLLLLKLFEPYSVRLYFSEVLQQEYTRYRAGGFDNVLTASERSAAAAGAMTPQRLYSFLADEWSPARRLQATEARGMAQVAAAAHALATLEDMRERALADFNRRKEEMGRLKEQQAKTHEESAQLASAIRVVDGDMQALQTKLQGIEQQPDSLDELSWLEHRTSLRKQLTEARRALRELHEFEPAVQARQKRIDGEVRDAEHGLGASAAALESVEGQLRDLRGLLADSTTARVRSVLKIV